MAISSWLSAISWTEPRPTAKCCQPRANRKTAAKRSVGDYAAERLQSFLGQASGVRLTEPWTPNSEPSRGATQRRMRSRQPMRQGVTGMWSTSHASTGRRVGRADRRRRRSFNIPMVSAKFTSVIFVSRPSSGSAAADTVACACGYYCQPIGVSSRITSRILGAGKFYNA
jgi:hypothetical protein